MFFRSDGEDISLFFNKFSDGYLPKVQRGNCWIVFDYRETTSEKSDCRTGEFAGSRLANYGVIPPLTTRNPELPARSIVLAGTACYIPAVPPQLHHLEWSKIAPEP